MSSNPGGPSEFANALGISMKNRPGEKPSQWPCWCTFPPCTCCDADVETMVQWGFDRQYLPQVCFGKGGQTRRTKMHREEVVRAEPPRSAPKKLDKPNKTNRFVSTMSSFMEQPSLSVLSSPKSAP